MTKGRQAVVVIHGIGEQVPMGTLRGFVKTLTQSLGIPFYNKPDQLSTLFELRRLTTAGKDTRTKTDFFEYYWAYNMRDTTLQQVAVWSSKILFRWPWSLPKRIMKIHLFLWITLLAGVAILLFNKQLIHLLKSEKTIWLTSTFLILTSLSTFILTHYVGDAARYTSANPGNIKERQKIRQEGITLLR